MNGLVEKDKSQLRHETQRHETCRNAVEDSPEGVDVIEPTRATPSARLLPKATCGIDSPTEDHGRRDESGESKDGIKDSKSEVLVARLNTPEEHNIDGNSAGRVGHLSEHCEGEVHVEGRTLVAAVPIHC